jgi:hypothetical protein
MRCIRGKATAVAALLVGVLAGATGCGDGSDAAPKVETVSLKVGETGEFSTEALADDKPDTTFRITVRSVSYVTEGGHPLLPARPEREYFAVVRLRIENTGDAPGRIEPRLFRWAADSGEQLPLVNACCIVGQQLFNLNQTHPAARTKRAPAVRVRRRCRRASESGPENRANSAPRPSAAAPDWPPPSGSPFEA